MTYLAALNAYGRITQSVDGTADRVRAAQGKVRVAAQETEDAALARMDRLARDVDRRCADARTLLGGAADRLLGNVTDGRPPVSEPDPEAALAAAFAQHRQDYEALCAAVEADRTVPIAVEHPPRAGPRYGLITVLLIAVLAIASIAYFTV
ncbi:hypothetical protein KZZ52_02040 [Dactylosporangium sp. AC04546]|uniref:hypothetical protein n=1 Tax=Dactylosporangium sp. AC04546 TaxID=2862460 RepID=UPI002E7B105A|nr:hypothetical protein [Dactylosporangium sp. AC04546]WVK84240.1 hypothetical protein KZZ52_02040 [Dactylosporangium sp. AC04546]